jgi:hypothetical protein
MQCPRDKGLFLADDRRRTTGRSPSLQRAQPGRARQRASLAISLPVAIKQRCLSRLLMTPAAPINPPKDRPA